MERFKVRLSKGERVLDRLLEAGMALEHECGGTLACASCCIIVHEGAQTLSPPSDDELDMLERAQAGEHGSRLACQAIAGGGGGAPFGPDLGLLRLRLSPRPDRHDP